MMLWSAWDMQRQQYSQHLCLAMYTITVLWALRLIEDTEGVCMIAVRKVMQSRMA